MQKIWLPLLLLIMTLTGCSGNGGRAHQPGAVTKAPADRAAALRQLLAEAQPAYDFVDRVHSDKTWKHWSDKDRKALEENRTLAVRMQAEFAGSGADAEGIPLAQALHNYLTNLDSLLAAQEIGPEQISLFESTENNVHTILKKQMEHLRQTAPQ